jgi:hypothetical protein
LSAKELDALFSNTEMLYNIHKELVKKFDAVVLDELMFGQIFLRVVSSVLMLE